MSSSYFLLDAQFQAFLDEGMDIAEADAAMTSLALQEYRTAGLRRYVDSRVANLVGLFQEEAFGRSNLTIRSHLQWYLYDGGGTPNHRRMMEERWDYSLTPHAVALIENSHREHKGPREWFVGWVNFLDFDGVPLGE